MTDASVVTSASATTGGSLTAVGSIQIQHTNQFFHVGQYYSGQTINSPSTCTDTTIRQAGVDRPVVGDRDVRQRCEIPPQVCVNMYDEHGQEGKPTNYRQ